MNNFFSTTKALVATIEREHYDDVAVVMVSAEMASEMNPEKISGEISESLKNKMKDYMCPENENAVDKLKKELIKSIHENV